MDPENKCPHCGYHPFRRDNLLRHIRTSCPVLRRGEGRFIFDFADHEPFDVDVYRTRSAYNHFLDDYEIVNSDQLVDIDVFITRMIPIVRRLFNHETVEKIVFKANFVLNVVLSKDLNDGGDDLYLEWAVQTLNKTVFYSDEETREEIILELFEKIKHEISEKMLQQSGWKLVSIDNLLVKTTTCPHLYGVGGTYIPTPKYVSNKKGSVRNPKNKDEECAKWAVAAALYEGDGNGEEIKNLIPVAHRYDWRDVTFPASIKDMKKFGRTNDMSINFYGYDARKKDRIFPIDTCKLQKPTHVDLLILQKGKQWHYTGIRNLSALVASQINHHNAAVVTCRQCLTSYDAQEKLDAHQLQCAENPVARVRMPEKDKDTKEPPYVYFKDVMHTLDVRIVVYADWESYLLPIDTCANNPNIPYSKAYQHHKPMSYGYIVVTDLPDDVTTDLPKGPQVYRGPNATQHFTKAMDELSITARKIYDSLVKMDISPQQQIDFDYATECYMCHLPFTSDKNRKVRDHCHITGDYRGPAHNNCNLKARDKHMFLPVLFHNLSNYDAHYIVTALGDSEGTVKCIASTEEKLITFSKKNIDLKKVDRERKQREKQKKQLDNGSPPCKLQRKINKSGIWVRYLDSYRFMNAGLETLAKSLPKEDFHITKQYFTEDELELVTKKGVFCYDFVDNAVKLQLPHLPAKHHFYNKLTETPINDAQYHHAQEVWQKFKCKSLGEYSDLYLKTDVLLLADVFQRFRKMCKEVYTLDPCWYYTAPGLAWEAALKHTGVRLELLTDESMYCMVEKGIRGGICQVTKRKAKARNKYTPEKEGRTFLTYLDANNLYGWAMQQKLPVDNFEWVTPGTIQPKDIMSLDRHGRKGYILEVDITYPEALHDKHNDLPFLAENRIPPGGKHKKLMPNLYNKEKYVIHYVALQQAIQHGLQVTAVHRVITFNQSDWLKKYIMLNTDRRTTTDDQFAKDFYKLMNNAVFGKTMENVRLRMNMELVTDVKLMAKQARSIWFKRRTIHNEKVSSVQLQRQETYLCKPIYVGMTILDLSKTHMYEFHYDVMIPLYGDHLALLYMDTDSFVYEISTDDFYADMMKPLNTFDTSKASHKHPWFLDPSKRMIDFFDTSDYRPDHPCYSLKNKKVVGMFKDEACGLPVLEFVGLRPKMYFILYGDKIVKKAKGVRTYALRNKVDIQEYRDCLEHHTNTRLSFQTITSKSHEIYTIEQNKLALSCDDDKRHILLPEGVDTLAHGHYRIRPDGSIGPIKRYLVNDSDDPPAKRARTC